MCNCNEGNVYNIGMGCCTPIVANADAYYTKSEIDDKLDDIITSGCCITPEEVDEKISAATDGFATEEWVEDKHYITGVDLSNYALKSEIPTVPTNVSAFVNDVPYLTQHQSLSGYATEQWVEDQGYLTHHQSLEGYVTENDLTSYTYDKQTIDEKVAGGGTFDPTQYYNKTATDALLNEKLDVTAYTPVDLSNYDTKSEVNTKISNATSLVYNSLTAHTANTDVHVTSAEKTSWDNKLDATAYTPSDLSNYYTKSETNAAISSATDGLASEQWVEDKHYITGVDLSNYALKSEIPTVPTNVSAFVNDAHYLTQHQSLSGYATQSWVQSQGYLTEHQDLSNYALKSEVNVKLDKSTFNGYSASTNTAIDSKQDKLYAGNNISITNNTISTIVKFWCGTEQQYNAIVNKDSNTIYMIHE